MSGPAAPTTDLDPVVDAIDAAGSAAFVHVGDRFDDDLRYLTRFAGPDRDYALVVVPNRAVLCCPGLFAAQADREFADAGAADAVAREVRTGNLGDPAGSRAAAVLDDLVRGDEVLVPRDIPHDAAVHLQEAGYELSATPVVAEMRTTKTAAERDRLRAVQQAAVQGMRKAETVLAEATSEGGDLRWEGAPLTTERLRREVNAELARQGVRDAGNTVIGAGPTCADLHFTGQDHVAPGETVLLDLSPRGTHGYYGDLTRTYVVDGDGGWERRAHVAVASAREAALDAVAAGVPAETVHEEAAAELAAHGFRVDSDEVGFVHGVGHGVGVSLHEGPSLRSNQSLQAGQVITIEPGVYDPDRGGVRLEDLVAVTADGYELFAPYPRRLSPSAP